MRTPLLVAALLILAACSGKPKAGEVVGPPKTNSPEIIRLIDMELATGQHLYILEYRTELPITDVANLAKEAETLWPDLRLKAEAAGHSSAGIRAETQPAGVLVQKTEAYTFIWEKDQAGEWHRIQRGG